MRGDLLGGRAVGELVGALRRRPSRPCRSLPTSSATRPGCRRPRRAAVRACLDMQHHQYQAEERADHGEDGELEAVLLQAVEEGRADAQADAVHEQVVEERLGEVVELQLDAVGRRPGRERRTDDHGRGHHAEAVALDGELADPHRHADGEEQQDVRVSPQELEERLHGGCSWMASLGQSLGAAIVDLALRAGEYGAGLISLMPCAAW